MQQQPNSYKFIRLENKFLTFYINNELYGIPVDQIREIIAMMKITPVPKTPDYIKGVINLRGIIIPLIDIRIKFNMGITEETMYTAIIICHVHDMNLGFIVDRVEDVLIIEDEHLAKSPQFDASIDTSFIRSVAEVDETVIMILDVEKIFETNELSGIKSLHSTPHAEGTDR